MINFIAKLILFQKKKVFNFIFFNFFFLFYFIYLFLLYNIVLVFPYINMNPP